MRTLVVEDDFVSRRLLQAILAPLGPCDVAVDGPEAVMAYQLGLTQGEPYDLVCLDIMLPRLDGVEVLREVRRLDEEKGRFGLKGAKVIMTTALSDYDTIMTSFRDQCEAYLTKPIEKGKLLEVIRGLGLLGAARA